MIYLLGPAQRGPQTPGLAVLSRSKLDRVCRRKALEASEASSVPDRTGSRRAWLRTLVDFSRFRDWLSELRSCVKVEVAVLGSRP